MIPAFLSATYAPSLFIVRRPRVEIGRTNVLLSSATKTRRLWMFEYFRTIPVGLNLVARVRLEYPPAIFELFLVIAHVVAIYVFARSMLSYTYKSGKPWFVNYMSFINGIFYIIVLIMSVVVHEVAHGFAAESQGDPTARYAGRLSLNPLRHIDMVGSVILPLILVISGSSFLVGWAKPVPYDERNLRNKKWGTVLVAGAGILSNFGLALVFGLMIRFSDVLGTFQTPFVAIASVITFINLLLGFFNLIPVPPLDGSKILFSLLPHKTVKYQKMVEYMSLPLLILFIFYIWPNLLAPLVGNLFLLITGITIG